MRNKPYKKVDPTTLINGMKSPRMYYSVFANGYMMENDCGSFKAAIKIAESYIESNPSAKNVYICRYDRTCYSSYNEVIKRF